MADWDALRRYHVLATLVEGPAGASYKVLDPATGELRLAKVWVTDLLRERPALRRLARDLAIARGVQDPRLLPYHDVQSGEGRLLVVRSWIDAPDLAHHPRFAVGTDSRSRAAAANPEELAELASLLLEALHVLHERGLVAHRVVPSNVFVPAPGTIVLADWGGRLPAARGDEPGVRRRDAVPPEVAAGLAADARSDLWAAAAIVYEIATGNPPPAAGAGPKAPPAVFGEALASVVERLLARDPAARLASARQALRALGRLPPTAGRFADLDFRSAELAGRDAVLADLRDTVDRLVGGQGDLVFLRGDAGIGKTRLLGEVARYAALRGARVVVGGPPEPSGYPFGRLAPCFEAIARDMASWPAEQVREVVQTDGRVLLECTPAFHELADVKRLPEPPALSEEASRRRLLRVAARALAMFAKKTPVVLLVDDLESADPLSFEFLRYVARTVIHPDGGRRGGPVLVFATYQGDAEAALGGLLRATAVALRAKGAARETVLKPLAPHEVRDLLVTRLGTEDFPSGFVAKVMADTEGNPLAIEETLSWLAAIGVLDAAPSEWVRGWEDAASAALPLPAAERSADDGLALILGSSGVHSMTVVAKPTPVGLRLKTLSADALRLLECAALAGSGASLDVVRMAAGLFQSTFDDALLEALRARAVLEEVPESVAFRHARTRDAVLATLDAARRRTVHARIGLAIEQHVGRLDERTPLLLAHHFHQAGDVERSLLYLPLAARILKDRHAPAEALAYFNRFFRHLQALEPGERERHLGKRLQALHSMAETLAQLDRAVDASRAYREMAALAEGTARERELVAAWSGLATLSLDRGDLEAADSFSKRAVELARRKELAIAVADGLRIQGAVAWRRRRTNDALMNLTGSLKVYQDQGDALGGARVFEAMGDVYGSQYDYRQAVSSYRQAYRQYRALDDKVGISTALNKLGRVHVLLGDPSRALAYHREALRLEREADDREGVGRTLDLLGEAYREKGDLARAEEAFKEALALRRELADVRGSADSLLNVAHVTLRGGKVDQALVLLEQTLTLARRAGNARAEAGALVRLAQAKLQRGDGTRAAELAEDALQRAQAAGDQALECRALLALAAASTGEPVVVWARRAEVLARTVGLKPLQFRAHVQLADALRAAGQTTEAHEHYEEALDVASALVAAARSARDGFLLRENVLASLRSAAEFVAPRTQGDIRERFPVLKYTQEAPRAAAV